MSDVDTSRPAVERRAHDLHEAGYVYDAATLRALAAERDALRLDFDLLMTDRERAEADRDAARAEAQRLREALEGMLAAFEYEGATEGECNACHAARAALADPQP